MLLWRYILPIGKIIKCTTKIEKSSCPLLKTYYERFIINDLNILVKNNVGIHNSQ